MATFFWVNGNGTWNGTNTGNWSTLSGGSGGAGPPTAADDVVFDVASNGAGTGAFGVTISTGATCRNLTASGLDGVMTLQGTVGMTIAGSLSLPATNIATTYTGSFTFTSTGAATITTGGLTLSSSIVINGVGGTFTLQDNLATNSTRSITLTNGTFDANNKNVTTGNFGLGAGTKTLTMGNGSWTMLGTSWNANTNVTGLTVSASTATINMTSGSAKTFAGGAQTWPTLNQGGSGALTIQQSNTFANITNTVQPATITFTSGTTQTVTGFPVAGVSGSLITLNASTPGSAATISDADGVNRLWYCSITDLTFTGGAIWRAPLSGGNVDGGGDSGISFISGGYIYSRRKNKVI